MSNASQAVPTGTRSTEPPELLAVEALDVAYGSLQVLFGVDLVIHEGARVALLGTNGAGKSTVLRAVSGLSQPTRGRVRFAGVDITRRPPAERVALGVVQVMGGKATFPTLSVRENLLVGAYPFLRDRRRVDAGIERAFDLFPRLAERVHQPAGTLSGGEQQMLALGRAMMGQPRLLMIDELSLGLSPAVLAMVVDALERIGRDITLLIVEQSLNIAAHLTDTAYFLDKGEVSFAGPTAELLDRGDIARAVFLGRDARRGPDTRPRARVNRAARTARSPARARGPAGPSGVDPG